MNIFLVLCVVLNGAIAYPNAMHRERRIVGGQPMKRGEWPFLVSLHYLKPFPFTRKTHMKHLCGGALIHPQWILTAGHCVGFFDELSVEDNWNVVLGEHNQYLRDLGEQIIRPDSFFIHPGFMPHETILCVVLNGAIAYPNAMHRERRIVGGQPMKRGEWPFLVSLHYLKPFPFTRKTHMKHLCGGALIHPQWILTAGHCVGFFDELSVEDNWNVVLGEHNQYLRDLGEQIIRPDSFFIHPGFMPHETNTLRNDIALIKLKEEATLTPFVGVVPLSNTSRIKDGTECQIGGWGQLASEPYGWGMYIPLKTSLYIINNKTCNDVYNKLEYKEGDIHMVIDHTVLCAGIPEYMQSQNQNKNDGNPDACNGDSGSPLVCPTGPNGEYEVAGVVSAGKGCGTGVYPGIYANIAHYATWINEVMENN